MKKILALTVTALMVMAIVGSGTWAYFTDSETSSGNTLAAGTLNLGLSTTAGQHPQGSITGTFSTSTWAPGANVSNTIYVNNEGTLNMTSLKLTITYPKVVNYASSSNITAGPGGATDELDKMITLTTANWDGSAISGLEGQTLYSLNGTVFNIGSLGASTEKPLYMLWTFNSSATNGCQGDSVNVTVTFNGSQS